MLRTVPDVGKIFLLIKANDKEAAIDRLKNEVCYVQMLLFVSLCVFSLKKKRTFESMFID